MCAVNNTLLSHLAGVTDELTLRLALRPAEAAKALGISPRTLWSLTRDGHIPCVRLGGGKRHIVLYPVAALQTWLDSQAAASDADDLEHFPK
jgi:excisionase family DNA binding protein